MILTQETIKKVEQIIKYCSAKKLKLTAVESCTGGLISAAITSASGSSSIFDYGFVTYANEAKENLVGVKSETLKNFGAVSSPTVEEMAKGALDRAKANISISVSGIAGPGGGTAEKPVGLVFIGLAHNLNKEVKVTSFKNLFQGDRTDIRNQALEKALDIILGELNA